MKEQEVINKCENYLNKIEFLYSASFLNNSGRTDDDGQYYSEIISKWLLCHIDKLNEIEQIRRINSYKMPSHNTEIKKITNRREELIAKLIVRKKIVGNIEFLDYQVPIKNSRKDEGNGKIDLLAVNHKEKKVYIFELKKEDSNESLLRCVLESFTYLKKVCKEKLLSDFDIPDDYMLKASPLVFKEGRQYKEYNDSNRVYLHELMKRLDVEPFFIFNQRLNLSFDLMK